MLNDPRSAVRDAGNGPLILDKYDPPWPSRRVFARWRPPRTRSVFWCLVGSLVVCIVILIVDLA